MGGSRIISVIWKIGPAGGLDLGEKKFMTPRFLARVIGWVMVPFSEMGR